MALDQNINRIKFLRTTVAGRKPALADLQDGELALNMTDRVLYTRNGNNIVDIGFGLGGPVNGDVSVTGKLNVTGIISGVVTNAQVLDSKGTYVESADTQPSDITKGITNSFVRSTEGWPVIYGNVFSMRSYPGGGGGALQLLTPYAPTLGGKSLRFRLGEHGTPVTWSDWKFLLDSENFNDYSPTKTGIGASGSWDINAATTTKLQIARTISLTGQSSGSVVFDGSGNVSLDTTNTNLKTVSMGTETIESHSGDEFVVLSRGSGVPSDSPFQNAVKAINIGQSNWNTQLCFDAYRNRMAIRARSSSGGVFNPWDIIALESGNVESANRLNSSRFFSAPSTQYYRVATVDIPTSGGTALIYLSGGQGFNSSQQQSASYRLLVKRGNTATSASLVLESADTNFVNNSEYFLKLVSDGKWEVWANITQYTTFYVHALCDKDTDVVILFDSGTTTKPSPVTNAYIRQFALLESNVASATKLQNARTINGVSFDGTSNIVIEDSTKLNLSGGTLTGDLIGRTPNVFTSLTAIGSGGAGAPFRSNHVSLGSTTSGKWMPLLKGSNSTSSGYNSHISFGMYRSTNDWSNSGAYIAVGGNDNYPTEALVYKVGGAIGTTSANGFVFESNAKFDYPTTFKSTITVEDNGSNFQKLIQMSNVTDGGYLAVGNTGSDKGYIELGTIDDADTSIHIRKRNSSNAVLVTTTLMDEVNNAYFANQVNVNNGLAVGSTSQTAGYGIGLYGGDAGSASSLPAYGIGFAGTSTFGTYDNSISPNDWATYFTMTGPITRGWIFKNGNQPASSNVASLSSGGVFACNSIQLRDSIIRGGLNSSPHHYIDIGKDGSDRQIFGSYLGKYHFRRTSNNSDGVVFDGGVVTASKFNGVASDVAVDGSTSVKTKAMWTGAILSGVRVDIKFLTSSTAQFVIYTGNLDAMRLNVRAGSLFHVKQYGTNNSSENLTVTSATMGTGLNMTVNVNWVHGKTVGTTLNHDVLACTYKSVQCSYVGTGATWNHGGPGGGSWSHLIRLNQNVSYPFISATSAGNTWVDGGTASQSGVGIMSDNQPTAICATMVSSNMLNVICADTDSPSSQASSYVALIVQDIS